MSEPDDPFWHGVCTLCSSDLRFDEYQQDYYTVTEPPITGSYICPSNPNGLDHEPEEA